MTRLHANIASFEQIDLCGYLPSPIEIATKCAEIRKKWTAKDFERRFVGRRVLAGAAPDWTPPTIDTRYLHGASNRYASDEAT